MFARRMCGDRCERAEKLVPVAIRRLELAVDRVEREADVRMQAPGVRGGLIDVGGIGCFVAGHRFGDLSWLDEQVREGSGPLEHRPPVRAITGWSYSLTRQHRRKASRDLSLGGCPEIVGSAASARAEAGRPARLVPGCGQNSASADIAAGCSPRRS